VVVGSGAVAGGGGGGATKFPDVCGTALSPPVPVPRPAVPPVAAALPLSLLVGIPAVSGDGGATKLPELAGSWTHAET